MRDFFFFFFFWGVVSVYGLSFSYERFWILQVCLYIQWTLLFQNIKGKSLSLSLIPNPSPCTCPTPTICNYKHPVSCVIEGHYGKANCISVSVSRTQRRACFGYDDGYWSPMHEPQWDKQKQTLIPPSCPPSHSLFTLIHQCCDLLLYKQQNAFIQCWIISGCLITEQLIAFISAVVRQRESESFPYINVSGFYVSLSVSVWNCGGRQRFVELIRHR